MMAATSEIVELVPSARKISGASGWLQHNQTAVTHHEEQGEYRDGQKIKLLICETKYHF